jgi:hypothetical protein
MQHNNPFQKGGGSRSTWIRIILALDFEYFVSELPHRIDGTAGLAALVFHSESLP